MIYDNNEFEETRTASILDMYSKWVVYLPTNPVKDARFFELQVLENIRLENIAKIEDHRAVLQQRKRDNFDNLSNADKLDVLSAMFDLVNDKPIEIAKVAITAVNKPNKVEFIAVEKQMQKQIKASAKANANAKPKHFDRNTLF